MRNYWFYLSICLDTNVGKIIQCQPIIVTAKIDIGKLYSIKLEQKDNVCHKQFQERILLHPPVFFS
jgi:hypothetical protein